MTPFFARSLALALGLITYSSAIGYAQTGPDPFQPGLRWRHQAGLFEPWIPRDVVFAAGGELVWSAPTILNPHLALLASGQLHDPTEPLLRTEPLDLAIGVVRVAAGDRADELFALAQFPGSILGARRTEVRRYDPFTLDPTTRARPVWTHDLGIEVGGSALLAANPTATSLVAAVFDDSAGHVQVDWIDPVAGSLLRRDTLAGGTVHGLVLSDDGQRLALTAGLDLWILGADGTTVHHRTLSYASEAMAFSGDGRTLVVGELSTATILVQKPSRFDRSEVIAGAANEILARAAISADGETIALAWWNHVNGVDVRIEIRDRTTRTVLSELSQTGGGLQNFPQDLVVSPDGRRIAAGLWGVGDSRPELLVFDRDSPAPLLTADLPGSIYALALDPSGTRIAVCVKHSHANQFASTGEVAFYDTGERDLQSLGPARPGGSIRLGFLHAGSNLALFGVGAPLAVPLPLAGVEGLLRLDPGAPILFVAAPADGQGRADLSIGLLPTPSLVGIPLAAQGAAIVGGRIVLSETMVPVVVL